MSNKEWMNNPALKNIDATKLALLTELVEQAETKSKDELLPFFLSINMKAKEKGIDFNDAETEVILNVLKTKMSPQDIKKIETIRNITNMISKKSKK
ncbi:MAG: hypothetical protein J6L69_01605 [Lachnospiraceae bacterium]|nr:hypothetical protein [Lachnospiraceae bacterium]